MRPDILLHVINTYVLRLKYTISQYSTQVFYLTIDTVPKCQLY